MSAACIEGQQLEGYVHFCVEIEKNVVYFLIFWRNLVCGVYFGGCWDLRFSRIWVDFGWWFVGCGMCGGRAVLNGCGMYRGVKIRRICAFLC